MDSRYCFSHTRAAQDLHRARLLVGKRLSALMHDQYYFNREGQKQPLAVGCTPSYGARRGPTVCLGLNFDGELIDQRNCNPLS